MGDKNTPFVLTAWIMVKLKIKAYLKITTDTDLSVQDSELNMLFHNFDVDPDHNYKWVWTELYRNTDDFFFQVESTPLKANVAQRGELTTHFAFEACGNVSEILILKIQHVGARFRH